MKTKQSSANGAAKRSAIARKAAQAGWKTMKSKGYLRAKERGRKAVESFLENR